MYMKYMPKQYMYCIPEQRYASECLLIYAALDFLWKYIKLYLPFQSIFKTDLVQVVEILLRRIQGTVCCA